MPMICSKAMAKGREQFNTAGQWQGNKEVSVPWSPVKAEVCGWHWVSLDSSRFLCTSRAVTVPNLSDSCAKTVQFFFNLFIYFWLCWVFVSVRGLSLVVASGGHSSSRCAGLSLSRPLLFRSTGSRRAGSVVVAHGPSCSMACGIFPDQGSNPCPLYWQADSQPLRHQGSPIRQYNFLKKYWIRKVFVEFCGCPIAKGTQFMTESIWLCILKVSYYIWFSGWRISQACPPQTWKPLKWHLCAESKRYETKACISFNKSSAFPEMITQSVLMISRLYGVLKSRSSC